MPRQTRKPSPAARDAQYVALLAAALQGATIAAGPDAQAIDVAARAVDLADMAMHKLDHAGTPPVVAVEHVRRARKLTLAA